MQQSLHDAAIAAGHPEWGKSGPANAGSYSDNAYNVPFYQEGARDNYASDYGKFFLAWYSNQLLQHGNSDLTHDTYSLSAIMTPSCGNR